MKNKLLIVISLLSISTVFSQDQELDKNFSLEEAIAYALENNRTAKNAQYDVAAAKKQKWETIASGLPQISASVDYQNWVKQQVSLLPAEITGGPAGTFTAVTFGTKQNMNATITLNQLLFDGSYIVGLQSAKVYLDISKNAKIKTDFEVRKAVINAYSNVLLAEESVKIITKNLAVLKKNLKELTEIYNNGLEEEESVEQLQITLLGVKSSLSNATKLKDLAYQMLNITLGLDISAKITLTDSLYNLTEQNTRVSLLTVSDNIKTTIDYKIAENNKISKELLLKLENSKYLPTLTAFLNVSYMANNNEFKFFNRNQKWYESSLFGVSLNIPIFSSGLRNASASQAKINLEKAKNDLTETEQQLRLQIAKAKADYQFALENLENKKQNLNLAERIEKKNQIKFFEGLGSSFDLRQAQTQLYAAQQEFLQAMFNVISNKTSLETILNIKN